MTKAIESERSTDCTSYGFSRIQSTKESEMCISDFSKEEISSNYLTSKAIDYNFAALSIFSSEENDSKTNDVKSVNIEHKL